MSRNTVWPTIDSLEKRQLLKRLGKPFGKANRYQVLVPIGTNETPIDSPSIEPNGAPIETFPITPNGAPPITPNEGRQSPQMERRKGYPKKGIQRRVSNKTAFVPTLEESQFAQWFKSSLPKDMQDRLPKNWMQSWCKSHRDLVRLDNRSPEQIREVCRWGRTDAFWSKNFRSPSKLRERDKQGTLWFDVFSERMKQTANGKTHQPVNLGRRGYQENIQLPD